MDQEIRTSQALHTYGPGAIADFPDLSVIVLSHDIPQARTKIENGPFWGEDKDKPANKLTDERLSIAFNVDFFVSPPSSDSEQNARIQTTRFPTILQCPISGELFDVRELEKDKSLYTDKSSREFRTVDETFSGYSSPVYKSRNLIPVRFVIATENGHLDNFPFDWYVHIKNKMPQEVGTGNRLFIKSKGNTASLKNVILESRRKNGDFVCKITLDRIFDQEDTFVDIKDSSKDYLQFVKGQMPKPWLGVNERTKDFIKYPIDDVVWPPFSESSDSDHRIHALKLYPRTLQRGAGNLYFPIVYKGISIPKQGYKPDVPEDFTSHILSQIRVLESASLLTNEETKCEDFVKLFKDGMHANTSHLGYTVDEGIKMIETLFSQTEEMSGQYTNSQLREQEFKCFLNPNINADRKEWYDSNIVEGTNYLFGQKNIVKNVVLLNKIRELKIFRGFTRIKPLMFDDLIFDSKDGVSGRKKRESYRIQDPRKDKNTNTLPATEVKGEGIFIQFDDDLLAKWEQLAAVKERFGIIYKNNSRYRKAFELEDDEILSARFIALHTFSHLLINELSIECGYGSSSLSEMIYCSSTSEQSRMNGILIYTSSSDSEGTLGGLVEKGDSTILNSIVEKALSKARWCSSDPLCIEETNGKGFMGVNLAACHSCALLPETSCCNMNKFLDRGLVIGTLDNPEIGLLNSK
jgi:hypothetical protein